MEFYYLILAIVLIVFCLFPFIACIVLLANVSTLNRKLKQLQWNIERLEITYQQQPAEEKREVIPPPVFVSEIPPSSTLQPPVYTPVERPAPPQQPIPQPTYTYTAPAEAPLVPPPPGVETPQSAFRQAEEAVHPGYEPQTPPIYEPNRGRTAEEWELLIGGKWMNWLGAIILVIGLGFFYKLAVDSGWITKDLRVLLGITVGAIMLSPLTLYIPLMLKRFGRQMFMH